MNWANRITLSRLALTVFFVVALNSSWHYARTAALAIFLIAGLMHPMSMWIIFRMLPDSCFRSSHHEQPA